MNENPRQLNLNIVPASIVVAGLIVAGALFFQNSDTTSPGQSISQSQPINNVVLPIVWGNMGVRMTEAGVLDEAKFREFYEMRGEFTEEDEMLLSGISDEHLKITKENAGHLLNLLWAFGLGNKNEILEKGEMANPKYGGAQNFASTGGWTLAVGDPMSHYSMHEFVALTQTQQDLVERVSKNIFRPCCSNSAHFPDCNHGMAMLGLLELMASQGANEAEMYQAAITANSYWFPGYEGTIPSAPKAGGCSV